MFRQILIPLDGSLLAEQVLALAKMFAIRFESSITLLRVVEPLHENLRVDNEVFSAIDQTDLLRGLALEYLEKIHREWDSIVPVKYQLQVGSPAATILDFAENQNMDLIAMVTHGRSGLQRWVYA